MKTGFNRCALAAAVLALSVPAHALFLNASSSFNGSTDVDGTNGEVATAIYHVMGGGEHFIVDLKRTDYDFDGAYGVNGDPWDSLNRIFLDLRDEGQFNAQLGYFAGLGYAMGFEEDIHLSENYSLMPRAGLSWNFGDGIKAFFGAAANLNEADNKFLPVLGVQFGKDADLGWSGSVAYPATRVLYRPSETLAFEGVFLTVKETYQLADDSKVASEGFVMEESYGVSAGIIYTPVKMLNIRAGVQSFFDREYTLYDRDGDEFASYDTDPSLGGYVTVGLAF